MQNADNVKTLVPLFASKNHKEKNSSYAGQMLKYCCFGRQQGRCTHKLPSGIVVLGKLLAAIYSMHLST